MIRWIVMSSMKLRLVVAAAAILLIVFGFSELEQMPVDALPEFSRPFVEIQTEALGLSAEEVEAMITTPMEADMLNGTPWVEEIRSMSLPGLSSIVLVFKEGTDIIRARQVVQERLTEVFALPNVSKPPVMINPVSSAGRCMVIGLKSNDLSLIEMSVLARWTIVPRLMGLPGVANVSIWGERERQLQVQVDPEHLRRERVALMQVIKTAGNALWASPLSFLEASTPGTGGWIDTPNQRLGIRHILPIRTAEDLSKVVVEGAPGKHLGDVATVVEDHQPLIGDAIVDDAPSLMLVVEKFPWANTAEVTEEVEEALAALRPGLSGMQVNTSFFRPATFLELAVDNLTTGLLAGGTLMILLIAGFSWSWRTTLVTVTAVFLSVIAAVMVLYVRGTTMNMVIIAGFMLALGIIIDDAIVDVANIARSLRVSRDGQDGRSTIAVVLKASLEARTPLLYATVILMLVTVPILFLEGASRAFWHPVATSYLLAIIASLLVSLVVTPALSLLFLRNENRPAQPPVSEFLETFSNKVSSWAVRSPRLALAIVGLMSLLAILAAPVLRQESLMPSFKETDLVIRWEGSSGASHPSMSRIATLASRQLRSVPGVRTVSAHMGRAIMSDKRSNINAGELWVSIDPDADYDQTVAEIQKVVSDYPGLAPEIMTSLEARVREELAGTSASPIVRIYGEDLKIIRKKADDVAGTLAGIRGIADVSVQAPTEMPTVEVEVDIERAKQYGLKPGDVRRSATTLVSGIEVGSLFEEQKVFNVVVLGRPGVRHSVTSIEDLLIDTPSGNHVRLRDVAHVRIVPSATVIRRDAVARYVDVTASIRGRDIGSVAADVERAIRGINFPLEYRAELRGEYAVILATKERVSAFAIAAVIGIFLILQAFSRTWRLATLFLLLLPSALLGSVLVVLFGDGGYISFGSQLGFIAILGIAIRGGVTLISRYQQADEEERRPAPPMMSVLVSTLTTAVVVLPLIFMGNVAGLEIFNPLARVVLGGLATSLIFHMIALPAVFKLFGYGREPELDFKPVTLGDIREVVASPTL